MLKTLEKKIYGQSLIFTNKRAVFWSEDNSLIISDLHIGKAAHFRKNGIAVPSEILMKDLKRLEKLIGFFSAGKIVVVGDLLHAGFNSDLKLFRDWREKFGQNFILVKGNHDRVQDDLYKTIGIDHTHDFLEVSPFHFIHNPEGFQDVRFTISGHIHPGVFIQTRTESVRLPSFALKENQLILPAFSDFTGLDTRSVSSFSHIAFTKEHIFEI